MELDHSHILHRLHRHLAHSQAAVAQTGIQNLAPCDPRDELDQIQFLLVNGVLQPDTWPDSHQQARRRGDPMNLQ
jgi:hypothetical protein